MLNPYGDLPSQAFWRTGVVSTDRAAYPGLFAPKFPIKAETKVATAGSCFAQHIGRYLRQSGVEVLDCEPAPSGLTPAQAKRFNFGIYSARYGNIYTPRQMVELLQDVIDLRLDEALVWERGGRYYDALRPGVEPEGCESVAEVLALREYHLSRVGGMLARADVFVFTLGLTEAWMDTELGRVYAIAPGVIAGEYAPERHVFHNFTHPELIADLEKMRTLLQMIQPEIKLLLTVSPVPLTATASDEHVLAATTWSKSTLRAAAGAFSDAYEDVDYFPSYEIVTTWAAPQQMFEDNLRSVRPEGVAQVMGVFLGAHGFEAGDGEIERAAAPGDAPIEAQEAAAQEADEDLICEEMLLEAFSK
ncbi:MAG: GSCFA domain-containing protein [Paracoccaceae bacterium]